MKIVGIITTIWFGMNVAILACMNVTSWLQEKCGFRTLCHKEAMSSNPDEYVKAELDFTITWIEVAFLLGGVPFICWFIKAAKKFGWA